MNWLLKALKSTPLLLPILLIYGCDIDTSTTSKTESPEMPKSITVKLLGPGERGSFFQVTSLNLPLGGKCFEGRINGVEGHGRLINGPDHIYNLYVYFHRRHSPKSDWATLAAITENEIVSVEFDVSKCSKNGFYEASKHMANFTADVKVST